MKYVDLKILADMRLDDAKALYHAGRYDGAVYLCGYVLEIALKARICKLLDLQEYPIEGRFKNTYATHDFDVLLKLSGLENKILLSKKSQPYLFVSWSLITSWSPDMRYEILNKSQKDVGNILASIIDILKWLKKSW